MNILSIPDWAREAFTEEQISANAMLYGYLSSDDLSNYKDMLVSSEKSIFNKYSEMPVKPVIKIVNLNSDKEGPAKRGYIAGLEFTF